MNARTHYVITSAALAALAAAWMAFPRPAPPSGPALPRPATITRPAPRVLPPTARDILRAEIVLALAPQQRTRLRALDAAWTRQAAALQARIDGATAEFSRFMVEARSSGRTSLQEIQRRSADIAELSAAVRDGRRAHSDEAVAALMDWQRARLGRVPRADTTGGER